MYKSAATQLVLKNIPIFTYPKTNRGFLSPPIIQQSNTYSIEYNKREETGMTNKR